MFNFSPCLQCDPNQQEWLAHTPQLPLSHGTDIWHFRWWNQSNQLTFCVSDCKCCVLGFLLWLCFKVLLRVLNY